MRERCRRKENGKHNNVEGGKDGGEKWQATVSKVIHCLSVNKTIVRIIKSRSFFLHFTLNFCLISRHPSLKLFLFSTKYRRILAKDIIIHFTHPSSDCVAEARAKHLNGFHSFLSSPSRFPSPSLIECLGELMRLSMWVPTQAFLLWMSGRYAMIRVEEGREKRFSCLEN